jgi:hypothetical protein
MNPSIPRLRALHIEFFGPTNTKGARVRIQSYTYLQEQGVIQEGKDMWDDKDVYPMLLLHDTRRGYTLGVPNFETPIK